MGGDEDDWNLETGVSQLALKVQTIHSRKGYVQNEATRPVQSFTPQKLFGSTEQFGP
jgi:hypothetical protein